MTDTGFRVRILTPEEEFLKESVQSIVAPGQMGYLGILKNHAPLVTPLVPGTLTLKTEAGNIRKLHVSGGFLEVSNNQAVILSDKVSGD